MDTARPKGSIGAQQSILQEQASLQTETSKEPKYKGVRKRKWGKWVSEIRLPNSRQRIWLGSFDSAEKAARAFDAALFCLRGPSATFNFPDSPPNITGAHSLTPEQIQVVAARFANHHHQHPPPKSSSPNSSDEALAASEESFEGNSNTSLDWSFLNLLDQPSSSSYTLSQFHANDFYPPPDHLDQVQPTLGDDYDDDDEGQAFTDHSSFLWNF